MDGGVLGTVWDIEINNNGTVFVGGGFYVGNYQSTPTVIEWDPILEQWSNVGNLSFEVESLASDSEGNLFACVDNRFITGQNLYSVTKWDIQSQSWSILDPNVDSNTFDLLIDSNDDIYICGAINKTNSDDSGINVAIWDKNNLEWKELGNGIEGVVGKMAFDNNDNLYVAGEFYEWNGADFDFYSVAKFDKLSQQWSFFPTLDLTPYSILVNDLGDIYVGGYYHYDSSEAIYKWNNSAQNWSPLGNIQGLTIIDMKFDEAGDLFAVGELYTNATGYSGILKYDIEKDVWINLSLGINNIGLALAFDDTGILYAGGYFSQAGNVVTNNIAQYQLCQDNMIITCEIPVGSYTADDYIQTTAPVVDQDDVTLNAPEILLNPGFAVDYGSLFEALQEGCNN